MLNRYFIGSLAVAIFIAVASAPAFAQVGELRGHVWMQQADGQKVPLADAQIDVFRTDMKAKYDTKTNKKGEWVFAGLPFIGEYIVAASHPTASPNFLAHVKAGRGVDVDLTVTPGSGKRLTQDEIEKANVGAAPTGAAGAESAADKAKREEMMKKNAEIEASNKKVTEANEIIARTFKTGNEALSAANVASKANNADQAIQKFTEAITQYDEGLAADPQQPAILTNKAVALKGRGVERYNAAIRSKTLDDAGRTAALDQAKGDFKAAAEASTKAATMLKAQTAPTDPADLDRYNKNKYAAFITYAESMRLFVSKVDPTQAEQGLTAYKDYMAVETDPAKKAKAQLDSAQMLLDSGQADRALAEFQAILQSQPDNPEANLGAGLALYAAQDKAKYQEAANYLQHFVDVAPDTNPLKADAKAILAELKSTEKVVPEKTPSRAAPKRTRP
jgi:tetratricopeptide (TPR) repeat protein